MEYTVGDRERKIDMNGHERTSRGKGTHGMEVEREMITHRRYRVGHFVA